MVAAVQSLRLCARACSRTPASRRIAATAQVASARRPFSSTPTWRSDDSNTEPPSSAESGSGEAKPTKQPVAGLKRSDKVVLAVQEGLTQEEQEIFRSSLAFADARSVTLPARWAGKPDMAAIEKRADQLDEYLVNTESLSKEADDAFRELDMEFNDLDVAASEVSQTVKVSKKSFWGEDEEEQDYLTEEIDEDDFNDEDIMSIAHAKLEEHREYREYARLAAWQMPLLSKLAQPFTPPTKEQCLRFRYTSYMGEDHPAQSKVVVEFSTKDLPLNGAQALKLKKLLGVRWNPETQLAKMSCEQFDHQAQNKRYLGDLVNKLIAEAKDTTDTFEDVPLDTRHHKTPAKPKFPKEWYLTVDRVEQLENQRKQALLLDQGKEDAGSLVDGTQVIEAHFNRPEYLTIPAHIRSPSLSPGRPGAQRQRRL